MLLIPWEEGVSISRGAHTDATSGPLLLQMIRFRERALIPLNVDPVLTHKVRPPVNSPRPILSKIQPQPIGREKEKVPFHLPHLWTTRWGLRLKGDAWKGDVEIVALW
ncbi:UNVERIFIED_CONTAM: hypothetical protein K2H54_014209 [Gekko kuhli]